MGFSQANPWAAAFGNNVSIVSWTALGNESGTAVLGPGWSDRSVQIGGTFAGATVVVEGSNDATNFFTLHDPFGNDLSFTAAGLAEVLEIVAFIRPRVSGGGGGVSINAYLLMVNKP